MLTQLRLAMKHSGVDSLLLSDGESEASGLLRRDELRFLELAPDECGWVKPLLEQAGWPACSLRDAFQHIGYRGRPELLSMVCCFAGMLKDANCRAVSPDALRVAGVEEDIEVDGLRTAMRADADIKGVCPNVVHFIQVMALCCIKLIVLGLFCF